MVNRATYKEVIINILRQKKAIDPIDLIDHFENGAVDVKVRKLREIIWRAVGTPIKLAILDLMLEKKIKLNAARQLILDEEK